MKIADITGTWKVNITSTGGTQVPLGSNWTAIISAKQDNAMLSGTFVTEHGLTGRLTGHVLGDIVSMTIEQGPIRPGTFHGVSIVNPSNNQMTGTYSGGDSGGTLEASVVAHKMKYYAVALNKIRTKLCSSEDEKGIPLWIILLFWLGAILAFVVIFLVLYFILPFIEKIIPNSGGYITLAMILIFGIYGLYQHFRGR